MKGPQFCNTLLCPFWAYFAEGLAQSGFLQSLTDPLGRVDSFTRDGIGRVLSLTRSSQTLGSRSILFTYDKNSNLTSITPPGKSAYAFEFDNLNRKTLEDPPQVPGGGNPDSDKFSFDPDSDLSAILFPSGSPSGSEFKYTRSEGRDLIEKQSDLETYLFTYVSQRDRRLSTVSGTNGEKIVFTYFGDQVRQNVFEGLSSQAQKTTVSYDYDITNRVSTRTIDSRPPVNYGYDLDEVLIQAGPITLSRDSQNGLIAETLAGQITHQITYDLFGQVSREQYTGPQGVLLLREFEYDALGRITAVAESGSEAQGSSQYQYDDFDRLSSVSSSSQGQTTLSYDLNGNRLNDGATYDAQDRLIENKDFRYVYTERGSLERKEAKSGSETTIYTYDNEGLLRSVLMAQGRLISYNYDGFGRRISRESQEGKIGYIYKDQLNPIAIVNAAGQITHEFIYASKNFVPDIMLKDDKTYRIISDERGSVRIVLDISTGQVAPTMNYDAFGKVLSDSNPGFQPFGYAGGLFDPDTQLVRFGARDYDPYTGRWLTKGPIRFDGGFNLYTYSENDPVSKIDPTGKFSAPLAGAAVGAAVGAFSGVLNSKSCDFRGAFLDGAKGALTGAAAGTFASAGVYSVGIISKGATAIGSIFAGLGPASIDFFAPSPGDYSGCEEEPKPKKCPLGDN